MDIFLVVLGICFLILGLLGCVLPMLPGPPLAYVALLLLQATDFADFSLQFVLIMGLLAVLVTILDYFVPIWGTKKWGGTKAGIWGSIVGLLIGLLFPPVGIIVGPFLGAVAGELIAGRNSDDALRAGWGAFVGFLLGTGIKLILCFVYGYYFVKELIV